MTRGVQQALTAERLRALLSYAPETGIFRRIVTTSPRARIGQIAGCRRWSAHITKDGKRRKVGYFDTKEEASSVYAQAARELFGEFARTA